MRDSVGREGGCRGKRTMLDELGCDRKKVNKFKRLKQTDEHFEGFKSLEHHNIMLKLWCYGRKYT